MKASKLETSIGSKEGRGVEVEEGLTLAPGQPKPALPTPLEIRGKDGRMR